MQIARRNFFGSLVSALGAIGLAGTAKAAPRDVTANPETDIAVRLAQVSGVLTPNEIRDLLLTRRRPEDDPIIVKGYFSTEQQKHLMESYYRFQARTGCRRPLLIAPGNCEVYGQPVCEQKTLFVMDEASGIDDESFERIMEQAKSGKGKLVLLPLPS